MTTDQNEQNDTNSYELAHPNGTDSEVMERIKRLEQAVRDMGYNL